MSKYYDMIRRNYINGYGAAPVKYFTDADLAGFVAKKILTQEEENALIAEKAGA